MLKSKSRWVMNQADPVKIEQLSKALNIAPYTAALLVNRGFETVESARDFLFIENQSFHDPFLLNDMDQLVARVNAAIEKEEKILIYGDYDADGVSSTTIMMRVLVELGAQVDYYIPNRFTEGYGPNEAAFRRAAENGVNLIITVDTGIAAIHEANIAQEIGVDLIITDHHEPGPELPKALAIVHPNLPGNDYPFKELAGVGVAFKVAHALLGFVPEEFLEIAAIGTIADLVSLTGENRLIAKKGIEAMRRTENLGIRALLSLTKTELSSITEETIGFSIGPRINAAGRLGSADPAVRLLLTEDRDEAEMLAQEIDSLNKDRKALVSKMTEDAIREVETHYPIDDNPVLIVGKEGWNPGVIGIVASRLVEKFYRPTIVFSYDKETGLAKGSARSIEGFDMFKNLSTCREILPHFGGHPMAAGMTLKIEDVDLLREKLSELAKDQLTEKDLIPLTYIDLEVDIEHVTLDLIMEMNQLAPYGIDNPKPKVMIREANISAMRRIGADQSHLKVTLANDAASLEGIGFQLGAFHEEISPIASLSAIGELAINEWNNLRKPQMFIQDLAVREWQLFDYRGLRKYEMLTEAVPKERTKWILFGKELEAKFKPHGHADLIVIETEDQAVNLHVEHENIVLLNLPPSKTILENLFGGKQPDRVYVYFYKENSEFFSTLPTRDHFKWFYAFLAKKGGFDLKRFGEDLAKYRGWTKETVDFMSQVFFDLNFVKIENGFISLEKNVSKKDLTESITYQQKQATITLENDLLYSSYGQLKSLFDQMIQGSGQNEEAVKEWI